MDSGDLRAAGLRAQGIPALPRFGMSSSSRPTSGGPSVVPLGPRETIWKVVGLKKVSVLAKGEVAVELLVAL